MTNTENLGAASMAKPPAHFSSGEEVEISCLSLDDYLSSGGIEGVDVIKMDVEGAELEVLQGAKGLLDKQKPIIILEFNDQTLKPFGTSKRELANFLEKKGYQLYRIGTKPFSKYNSREDVGLSPVNVLAAPAKLR